MIGLARTFWRSLSGGFQWRLLWLFNAKFSVGVSAVVVDPDGRILLLRHTFRRTDGWSLPSGWMQAGERVAEAIVREIREETGLEAAPVTIFAVRSGFRLRVGFFLLCTVPAPVPNIAVDGREVLEAGFFAPGALPDGVPDSDQAAIDEALAVLRRDPPPLL